MHITGDINKYINMQYSYLAASAGYGLLVLTIIQNLKPNKEADDTHNEQCDHDHCGHNHSKEDKWYKKQNDLFQENRSFFYNDTSPPG